MCKTWYDFTCVFMATLTALTPQINDRLPTECNYNKNCFIWIKNKTFGKDDIIAISNIYEVKRWVWYERMRIRWLIWIFGSGLSFICEENSIVIYFLI